MDNRKPSSPLIVLVIAAAVASPLRADRPAPTSELAVDQVALKRGPRLLGAVVERAADGTLSVAVSREWLKSADPKFYEAAVGEESAERKAALEQLQSRLAEWLELREGDEELLFFLRRESRRVEQLAAPKGGPAADEAEFLLLSFPASRIERVFVQPALRKQVALLAWREQVAGVETRSLAGLQNELKKRGLDPAKVRVDLSDRLSIRRQSDIEWFARQALVEYQYRRPIDFQGTGSLVVRTGSGAKAPAMAELLAATLKSQIEGQLAELLEESGTARPKTESDEWLKAAARLAEKEDAGGFRVTRVAPDVAAGRVSVETRFVARMPAGAWETVWRHAETLDASQTDKALTERIANDPSVKQALELFRAAGVGGDEQIQAALRIGAATMQAQQTADSVFFEFRDLYLKRLDGPALRFSDSQR